MEISPLQASGMEEQKETVNTAKYKSTKQRKQEKKSTTCFNCGKVWPHTDRPCPAKDKECHKCQKIGHFAKVCKSEKQISRPQKENSRKHEFNSVDDLSSDDEYTFSVSDSQVKKLPITTVKIGNFQRNVLVDSGASINVIDNDTFNKMNRKKKIKLEKAGFAHTVQRLNFRSKENF
jgi:hypothetical protein